MNKHERAESQADGLTQTSQQGGDKKQVGLQRSHDRPPRIKIPFCDVFENEEI